MAHKRKKKSKSTIEPPSFHEFDPVDDAAERLAELTIKPSKGFKKAKQALKEKAKSEVKKMVDGGLEF